jgi:aldehyde dehydrogenase (NAD(P)+)
MDTQILDKGLAALQANKKRWATLPMVEKIDYLDQTIKRSVEFAEEWALLGIDAKGLTPQSPLSNEEWIGGPYAFLNWMQYMKKTLNKLISGKSAIGKLKITERANGQTVARVYPNNFLEKLILSNYYIDVWMKEGVTPKNLEDSVALFYKQHNPKGRVSLVLGAGNVSSIVPLDIFYKLYAEGEVVMIKMNPINDYLGPIFEKIFAPFIENSFIKFAYGGGDVGAYLTHHDDVETIHITGSGRTHDVIVFGGGEEGQRRKSKNRPVLNKPITSELGGISPTIVVPGPWSNADFKFQAENIATQKLQNAGHNCIATQVLIMPEEWIGTEKLLDEVEKTITNAESRPAYYPGAEDRQNAAKQHPKAKVLDSGVDRTIIYDVDTHLDEPCFTDEYFSPVLTTVSIPGKDPAAFLLEAVKFANEKLDGTLGANIIIHPKTIKAHKAALDLAIADLRYGGIGVNTWCALAFLGAGATWGAYPGHTLDNIQSGNSVVHNAFLFDKPQKTVATGPFRNFPRSILSGDLHMAPRPLWFVTNKTAHKTAERLTYFTGSGNLLCLPGIFASALRG